MSNIVVFNPADLRGGEHVVLGVPVELEYKASETGGGKGIWHSIPIRARVNKEMVPMRFAPASDNANVAVPEGNRKSVQGLQRLALRLQNVWVSRISAFGDQDGHGDDSKVQMSISLTGLNGATQEEQRVAEALDQLTNFIRRTMVGCKDIRAPLKIVPGMAISEENVDGIASGVLDSVQICRSVEGTRMPGESRRFMYPKVSLTGFFRTQLFAPNGKTIPVAVARSWGMGTTASDVVVELESVTCTKLVKTIRMRVLEAILEPPTRQPTGQRFSLLFPDHTITQDEAKTEDPTSSPTSSETGSVDGRLEERPDNKGDADGEGGGTITPLKEDADGEGGGTITPLSPSEKTENPPDRKRKRTVASASA